MPKKTVKPAPRKNRKNLKPEQVYKVIPKKKVAKKQSEITQRHHKKRLRLHTKISKKSFLLIVGLMIIVALGAVFSAYHKAKQATDTAQEAVRATSYSDEMAKKIKLIGTKKDFEKEIINYQSAPDDLKPFLLKDYRNLKANCIVNGTFIGPARYEVANVVYDSFARISKDCNGEDTVLLSKISGKWTVVITGNDLPSCSLINAFDIPRGISEYCREGFVTYTNPNP